MSTLAKDRIRQLANLLIIPTAIVINALNGPKNGEVARQTEPLLAASGWTFMVWNVIFLGLLGYAVFQALPSQRTNPALRRIGPFTAIAAACTGVWVLLFTSFHFTAAWLTILVLLGSLIAIEVLLGDAARSGKALWLVRVPFGVMLGWVSAAAILNTAQWLHTVVQWSGAPLTPLSWSLILVAVALALGMVMGLARRNLSFVAVMSWALLGIATYVQPQPLVIAAAVGAGTLAVLFVGELIAMRSGRLSLDLRGQHLWN
ncbi:MAG: hypothetical protein ACO1OB_22760 [Archangium sp.]